MNNSTVQCKLLITSCNLSMTSLRVLNILFLNPRFRISAQTCSRGKFLSPNSWNFMFKLLTVGFSLDTSLFNVIVLIFLDRVFIIYLTKKNEPATPFRNLYLHLFLQFYHLIIAFQVLFTIVMNHFYKCLREGEEKLTDFLLIFKVQIGFDLIS